MKITTISAHLIETTFWDPTRNLYSPFCRIQHGDKVNWIVGTFTDDYHQIWPKHAKDKLEAEFQETYGVINEQLSLF